ncbi:uncharacterized protein [Dysidea avara]|uniref:uncharacterized protein n=1 Tax=Dysidea avara TaxID=196820 RepID=UPI0033348DF2
MERDKLVIEARKIQTNLQNSLHHDQPERALLIGNKRNTKKTCITGSSCTSTSDEEPLINTYQLNSRDELDASASTRKIYRTQLNTTRKRKILDHHNIWQK